MLRVTKPDGTLKALDLERLREFLDAKSVEWRHDYGGTLAALSSAIRNGDLFESLDGRTTACPIVESSLQALAVGPDGSVWVGTEYDGLFHCSPSGWWKVFTMENSPLPEDDVRSLAVGNDGSLWVGFTEGLAHYDSGKWELFGDEWFLDLLGVENLRDVENLAVAPDGALWAKVEILTEDYEGDAIIHFISGKWEVFPSGNSGLPDGICSLAVAPDGSLWAGTGGGLAHYVSGQWEVVNGGNSGLPDGGVGSLAVAPDGSLWMGFEGGLAHYASGQWEVFDVPYGVVRSLAVATDGSLWVGPYTPYGDERNPNWKPLAHFTSGQWEVFDMENSGLPGDSNVGSLATVPDGSLWVGAGSYLAHYTSGQWEVFGVDLPLPAVDEGEEEDGGDDDTEEAAGGEMFRKFLEAEGYHPSLTTDVPFKPQMQIIYHMWEFDHEGQRFGILFPQEWERDETFRLVCPDIGHFDSEDAPDAVVIAALGTTASIPVVKIILVGHSVYASFEVFDFLGTMSGYEPVESDPPSGQWQLVVFRRGLSLLQDAVRSFTEQLPEAGGQGSDDGEMEQVLAEIPGLGNQKMQILLAHFRGDLGALRRATPQELSQINGIGRKLAEAIVKYLSRSAKG